MCVCGCDNRPTTISICIYNIHICMYAHTYTWPHIAIVCALQFQSESTICMHTLAVYNIMFDWDFTMMSHEEKYFKQRWNCFLILQRVHTHTHSHTWMCTRNGISAKELFNLTHKKVKIFAFFHLSFGVAKKMSWPCTHTPILLTAYLKHYLLLILWLLLFLFSFELDQIVGNWCVWQIKLKIQIKTE